MIAIGKMRVFEWAGQRKEGSRGVVVLVLLRVVVAHDQYATVDIAEVFSALSNAVAWCSYQRSLQSPRTKAEFDRG